ncbi:MAG: NAD(P)H-dependent oxidoreductase [Bacteroidetes bacterium]|nr:MAG: NAD(P)H-dependent oxidoreductase [Bacteroidota bacterium]
MTIINALNWRYATKRMNGKKIPKAKLDSILDAISLAPSSFGLQPYSILVVEDEAILSRMKAIAMMQPQITEASAVLIFAAWDKLTLERIDAYIQLVAKERNVTLDSLKQMKGYIENQLKNSDSDNLTWSAKQAYIALGVGLVAAALEEVDSTPMEGFDHTKLDELLNLRSRGLCSSVLLALGYRDDFNDYLVHLKKVRRSKDNLFLHFH